MELKTGDRLHVMRLNGGKVNFYATIGVLDQHSEIIKLINCTDKVREGMIIYLPNSDFFGVDKDDYYTLSIDEKETHEILLKLIADLKRENETLKEQITQLGMLKK